MRAHGLHVVTGKGGVGKSTIAAALALAAARAGARVLAIELGEPGGLGRILGATPAPGGAATPAAGGVAIACFDGAAALAEYLTRRVHLGAIARAVIEHPLYEAFVAAAPGLRELMAVGKIRDEYLLQGRWDVVVVDAGASGHALEHLRMPSAAAAAFASGRVHREAAKNAALLRDRGRCAVHVVATAEEMPLREAVQTIAALRELDLALGTLFVNRCVPPAPPGVDEALARIAATAPAVAQVLGRARAWAWIQEHGIAAVEAELGVRAARLPRVADADGLAQALALAPRIAEATP